MRKLNKAIDRILINEIGYRFIDNKIKIENLLGCYEHFYNDNFLGHSKFGTHYVALSFVIKFEHIEKVADVDKIFINWKKIIDKNKDDEINLKIHKYTLEYLNLQSIKKLL